MSLSISLPLSSNTFSAYVTFESVLMLEKSFIILPLDLCTRLALDSQLSHGLRRVQHPGGYSKGPAARTAKPL